MRGQFVHIDELEPVPGRHGVYGDEGEIGEMFVVNRIELIAFHQSLQMREFERNQTIGLEELHHPRYEVIEIWNLGEDIIADDEIGVLSFCDEAFSQSGAEEIRARGNALINRNLRDIRSWLYPKHRNAER